MEQEHEIFIKGVDYLFSSDAYNRWLVSQNIFLDYSSEGAKFLMELNGEPVSVVTPVLGRIYYDDYVIQVKPEFCIVAEVGDLW